ncbi:unnamed protein product [marine sediment metagenome]|uniref:AAA domain-containing protein n=1 Tax=marine sediment metagenome TaxID=412755 RepID=X1KRT6_9ZZZZ
MHFPEFPNSRPPRPLSEVVKKPFGEYGPHLIPADVTLAGLLYQLANANNRDKRIRSWIEKGRNNPTTNLDLSQYDIILYDNAPATSVLSRAALVASDYCISPKNALRTQRRRWRRRLPRVTTDPQNRPKN